MSELKPCQCGAPAFAEQKDAYGVGWWRIECTSCGIQTREEQDYSRVVAAWNTRATDAELAALRERAERAEAKVERMRDAILAVHAVDSGAWLKDCTTVLFNCGQGHEERMSLMRSLNQLYKALAEPED